MSLEPLTIKERVTWYAITVFWLLSFFILIPFHEFYQVVIFGVCWCIVGIFVIMFLSYDKHNREVSSEVKQ